MLLVSSHRSDSLYRIPSLRTDAFMVYTNKSPVGAYRGFGNPQISFAWESQLDIVAEKLGMDPAELRLKNATQAGDTTARLEDNELRTLRIDRAMCCTQWLERETRT
jgi:CO/xanthine dehydrogenase Mo-binding subunit